MHGRMVCLHSELEDEQDAPQEVPPTLVPSFDRRALADVEKGDRRGALTVLMDGYGAGIYRYCYNVLRCRTSADDVYQTVFLQVYEDIGIFSGESLRQWLYTIAHNRCLDALKLSRRWFARFSLRDTLVDEPDPARSSEDRLIEASLAGELTECLGKLKPHVRVAVLLRYQEGFSYEEMARICRERPATLQARVARALPLLRACLTAKGIHL